MNDSATNSGAEFSDPNCSWQLLLSRRSEDERDSMRSLPYRLGITWRPDGGWRDYVAMPPMYDLPSYIAESAARSVSTDALDRFRLAHHCSGFYGLLIDRVADGQIVDDALLRRDRRWLRRAWLDSLAAACGDHAAAERGIRWALGRWRRGVALARARTRDATFDAATYARSTAAKVAFLWIASELLLRSCGNSPRETGQLRRIFERVMFALQCCDDAADDSEDRELHGASVSQLLRVTPAVLRATACRVFDDLVSTKIVPERLRGWCLETRARARALIPTQQAAVAALGASYVTLSITAGGAS